MEKIEEILKILEKDGRASEEEIATMVGIEEEKVKEKISELEKKGIIRKYKAIINHEKAGLESVQALIELKISPKRNTGYDSIAERNSKFEEVKSIHLVSGEYDLSVLVCGKTMKEVAHFVAEKIAPLEQVRDTVTHFLLKTYKEDGEIWEEEEKETGSNFIKGKRMEIRL